MPWSLALWLKPLPLQSHQRLPVLLPQAQGQPEEPYQASTLLQGILISND